MFRVLGRAGALALALVTAAAPAAQAEEYRFWSYWTAKDGSWTYASSGPASHQPADGSVEGWRFTVSSGDSPGKPPREAPSFEEICAGIAPKTNRKRVAVVIDYGTADVAPQGQQPPESRTDCVQAPEDATGRNILAVVTKTQMGSNGLVCEISGYPRGACGGAAKPDKPSASKPASPQAGEAGGSPTAIGPALGGVAIAVVAVSAVVMAVRRRRPR